MKVIDRYGMHFHPLFAPVKIDTTNRVAHFKYTGDETIHIDEKIGATISGNMVQIPFDMLHLAPPQAAPEFIRNSSLANKEGWVDVDHHSLQHKTYNNVFSLGDVAALPTAKTGAAIRKQVPVVVDNLLKLIGDAQPNNDSYNGYSSCPLVTGYGKMVLAEFNYRNEFTPDPKLKQMLVFDSSKEHYRLWLLKKYGLPYLYWNKMLKGKDV